MDNFDKSKYELIGTYKSVQFPESEFNMYYSGDQSVPDEKDYVLTEKDQIEEIVLQYAGNQHNLFWALADLES